jgi:hypothetical protein
LDREASIPVTYPRRTEMRKNPKPSGWYAITEEDVPEDVEREVVLSTGEIVTLEPYVAILRHVANREYAERHAAYCAKHGHDPKRVGCVDCEGTGQDYINNLPCRCKDGTRLMKWINQRDAARTEELRKLIK